MPEEPEYVPKKDFIDTQRKLYEMEAKLEAIKGERDKKQDEIYRLRKQVGVESTAKNEIPPVPPVQTPIPATTTYNGPSYPQNAVTNSPITPTTHDHQTYTPPVTISGQSTAQTNSFVPPETIAHKMHPWEAGCVMCDPPVANPNFKPEMKCDPKKGGCGGILGSFETALSMKHCPHCLKATEAAPANEDGYRKAMEYLKTPRVTV